MSNYNLNDNVDDSFGFEVGGHKYKMTYPTMEQLEELKIMVDASREQELKGEPAKEDDEKIRTWMYSFIQPVGQAPPIDEVMQKQNIRVLKNFQTMFRTEFGLE